MKFSKLLTASALALASTSIAPAFAEEQSKTVETTSITTMDQLDEKFNLQTVTEIPEGVIPLEFDSIEEAVKYLEQATTNSSSNSTEDNNQLTQVVNALSSSTTTNKTGKFATTTAANLSATISYATLSNGMIDIISVTSRSTGDASWSWSQSSYTTQKLDGGRSVGINIKGVLTQSIVVNGVLKNYSYNETVYVEIPDTQLILSLGFFISTN
ncbi:hypothetical protein FOH38_01825 [Lysinibacillus fusiformis]|nr:hypothetical protein FOH38_01825 [Lysinibacillus fusiformis]